MSPRFAVEPASGPSAAALINAYYDELRERLGGFDPRLDPRPAEGFEPPDGAFVVAYQGEQAIACGGVKRLSPTVVEIKQMFVAAEARRRGVARALLAELEAIARLCAAETPSGITPHAR